MTTLNGDRKRPQRAGPTKVRPYLERNTTTLRYFLFLLQRMSEGEASHLAHYRLIFDAEINILAILIRYRYFRHVARISSRGGGTTCLEGQRTTYEKSRSLRFWPAIAWKTINSFYLIIFSPIPDGPCFDSRTANFRD